MSRDAKFHLNFNSADKRSGASRVALQRTRQRVPGNAGRTHLGLRIVKLIHHTLSDLQRRGDTGMADMLRLCEALHTARTVDEQAVFLRCGALSVGEAPMRHANVGRFCEMLRPHVFALLESSGYPPYLPAPIPFDYVAHNNKPKL